MSGRRLATLAVLGSVTVLLGGATPTPFLNGKVVWVTDGDTVWVKVAQDSEWIQVRFYGVDCPESAWEGVWPAQRMSTEAKEFTISKVKGKTVSIRVKGEETYDRAVGELFLDGQSMSRELLRQGLAWWNKKFEPNDLDLQRMEAEAKQAGKGIWAENTPTAPWDHRRNHAGG